jgi:8-amino-7-oxononanoate synthase
MLTSLSIIKSETWRRVQLQNLIKYFRNKAKQLNLPLLGSHSSIQPIMVGSNNEVMHINDRLLERGFWVGAIRPPTVPPNTARLRIGLNVAHTIEQINNLLESINEFD